MLVITGNRGGCKSALSGNRRETAPPVGDEDPSRVWLNEVLYGGRVSGVAQHLALLIYRMADESGRWSGSLSDLAKRTGWTRPTISKYLPVCRSVMAITNGGDDASVAIQLRLPTTDEQAIVEAAQAEIRSGPAARALAWTVWQKTGGVCHYCGVVLNPFERHARNGFQIDHVQPVTRGGGHEVGNLVPACKICNSAKRDRIDGQWGAQE